MSKLQPITFRSIDDFLNYIPENELKLVTYLRQLIRTCIPHCDERLAYNVPFYYQYTRICFIWPASVPWGNVQLNGVQLGFCQGHLLTDTFNYLDKGNRKQVYTKTFRQVSDIDHDLIKTYLLHAAEIDEQLHHAKKKKRK